MRFPSEFLTALKSRLSILDVASRYLTVTKKGPKYFALCPFHHEKTPSFHLDPAKDAYYCFGCKEQGDIIDFVQKLKNVDFTVAVESLAQDAGLPLPEVVPEQQEEYQKRHYYYQVMAWAQEYFRSNFTSEVGKKAQEYVSQRQISLQTADVFMLGYIPAGKNKLKSFLQQKDVSLETLQELSLVSKNGDYDFFRERLMFPIQDRQGRIIAFGGRTLGSDQPKYINSGDTPLYTKGHNLYGYLNILKSRNKEDPILVVEGYMDVIALYQHGFDKAVAPLGTAFTPTQMQLVWRASEMPIICFDGDRAGLKAAWDAANHALPHLKAGYSVKFLSLSAGDDPDSYLKVCGAAAFRKLLANALPLSQFLWQGLEREYSGPIPEQKAKWQQQIGVALESIQNPEVKGAYHKQFIEWGYGNQPKSPILYTENPGKWQSSKKKTQIILNPRTRISHVKGRLLLALPIRCPEILEAIYESFCSLEFEETEFNAVKEALICYINDDHLLEKNAVNEYLIAHDLGHAIDKLNIVSLEFYEPALKGIVPLGDIIKNWEENYHLFCSSSNKEAEFKRQRMILTSS